MGDFTHFDEQGNAVMVDVHAKDDTYRVAVATGKIKVSRKCMKQSRTIQPKREMSLVWRGLPELWRQKRMPN